MVNFPDARDLKGRVDLAAFAGQVTRLRRFRRQLVGLCPLHSERHPSFYVHPQRQVFYCFGCGLGGDIYSFICALRGCDFPAAVQALAEFIGTQQKFLAPSDRGPEGAEGAPPAKSAKQAAAHSGASKPDPELRPRAMRGCEWPSLECAAEVKWLKEQDARDREVLDRIERQRLETAGAP